MVQRYYEKGNPSLHELPLYFHILQKVTYSDMQKVFFPAELKELR